MHRILPSPVLFLLVLVQGCAGDEERGPLDVTSVELPREFLFGTATAGFQVDMGCPTLADELCVDASSDWYQFIRDERVQKSLGDVLSNDDPARVGPGHWELYESDFDRAADELGSNAFRMSFEWSRIFPHATDEASSFEELSALADSAAVEHYHAMLRALNDRGMEPLVTIHHYTMPAWIHDGVTCHLSFDACEARGWLDRERTVREIAKYAGFVAREFGAEIDLWATQNEPFAVVLPGFVQPTLERVNPPALSLESELARESMVAMIEAHARMVDAVRESDAVDADGDGTPASVGLVYAVAPVVPANPDRALDVSAAESVFYLWNLAFLDAVALGRVDDDLDGNGEPRPDLAGRLDWLGLNYKSRARVRGASQSAFPNLSPLLTIDPLSLSIDEIHPAGLYEMIDFFGQRYDVPMIITENNGQSVPLGDMERESRYVVENVSWMLRAIADGHDVRGYFYWTLMDNYEWNRGMSGKKLGLYAVDVDSPGKERTARGIADVFAELARSRGVPDELARRFPIHERQLGE